MFATIDFGISVKVVGGVCLIFAGLLTLWFRGELAWPSFTGSGSDRKAPQGFGKHIAIIKSASPAASTEVREGYFAAELSEADTLRAEVKRLSASVKPDAKVKAEVKTEVKTEVKS